ncbi:MAG: glutamine-hydrolyzing carbamoyl-phosphate synthase small subunit [Flavobacteriales bacterium]|nr:glutamine-hydrolyzing carbamoyl-phosphate synthase small subunit [Flavobacteriales bacterium]
MKHSSGQPAILLLEDGTFYEGRAAGAIGTVTGEICFNTGMTGYQEIFTDPSYYGQIIVTATSHIGNYGVHEDEEESDSMKIAGLVCKKFSSTFSRYDESTTSLQSYFEDQNKVAISDVDTRAIVTRIRDKGAMNAIISSEELDLEKLKAKLAEVPSMNGLELSSKVATKEAYELGDSDAKLRVALLDLGVKKNILRCLADRGCFLKVFPVDATYEEMKAFNPDGYMLTNGPGDPAVMTSQIETVKELTESGKAVFGICLGHQVLALASGLKTFKMHNGHRGVNHPVKNLITGKCEVTSQNHGFVVDIESLKDNENIEMTHQHLNDGTLAGIRLKDKNIFSVQFHPESSAGPNDSRYLFDEFIDNMMKVKKSSGELAEA